MLFLTLPTPFSSSDLRALVAAAAEPEEQSDEHGGESGHSKHTHGHIPRSNGIAPRRSSLVNFLREIILHFRAAAAAAESAFKG